MYSNGKTVPSPFRIKNNKILEIFILFHEYVRGKIGFSLSNFNRLGFHLLFQLLIVAQS